MKVVEKLYSEVIRVIWRGFNHQGEPSASAEDIENRRKLIETPSARRDLKTVIQAPNGDFVAFCGMFYEPTGKFAYVELVATAPDFRRLGLGKAAVLEGIRRCSVLGATAAYVGNDLPIYRAVGFKKVYNSECWVNQLADEESSTRAFFVNLTAIVDLLYTDYKYFQSGFGNHPFRVPGAFINSCPILNNLSGRVRRLGRNSLSENPATCPAMMLRAAPS